MKTSIQIALEGYDHNKEYDVEIAVLIHYSGWYRNKINFFKKYGLYNYKNLDVHVSILGSAGDGVYASEIVADWPGGLDVTFLEFNSKKPIPKINGYYLWLGRSHLKAHWYMRVDDDSITDVNEMICFVNARYRNMPVHLMTSPHRDEPQVQQFVSHFSQRNFEFHTLIHEHESSMTSKMAMDKMFNEILATELLLDTAESLTDPGDQMLALLMQCLRVPLVTNPHATKDFAPESLRLTGGHLFHIHYVNWTNVGFVACFDAMIYGAKIPMSERVMNAMLNLPISFGRCIGRRLASVTLLPDGTMKGSTHKNETYWLYTGDSLMFLGPDRIPTTVFNSLTFHQSAVWLFGPHMLKSTSHFLTMPRSCIERALQDDFLIPRNDSH